MQPGVLFLDGSIPIVQQAGGASPVVDEGQQISLVRPPGLPKSRDLPTTITGNFPAASLVPLPPGVTIQGGQVLLGPSSAELMRQTLTLPACAEPEQMLLCLGFQHAGHQSSFCLRLDDFLCTIVLLSGAPLHWLLHIVRIFLQFRFLCFQVQTLGRFMDCSSSNSPAVPSVGRSLPRIPSNSFCSL